VYRYVNHLPGAHLPLYNVPSPVQSTTYRPTGYLSHFPEIRRGDDHFRPIFEQGPGNFQKENSNAESFRELQPKASRKVETSRETSRLTRRRLRQRLLNQEASLNQGFSNQAGDPAKGPAALKAVSETTTRCT
jgi:hypothetical protein